MSYIEELGKISREVAFDVRDGRIYGDEDEEIAAAIAAKVLRDVRDDIVAAMTQNGMHETQAQAMAGWFHYWAKDRGIDLAPGEPVHEV